MNFQRLEYLRILFLCICLTSSPHLFSQQETDSLANKTPSELESLYNNSKNAFPQKAKVYAQVLYKLAHKRNRKYDIAEALYKKAYIESKLGNNNSALQLIEESRTLDLTVDNDSLLLKNANLKGIIYTYKNDYILAIDSYLEAKVIAERLGNNNDVLIISHNIAIIKQEINDLQGALDMFLSNLERIEASNNPLNRQKLLTYFTITDTYLRLENLERATFYNEKGLHESADEIHFDLRTFFLSNKAIISFQQDNFEETIRIYNSMKNDVEELSNTKLLIITYLHLGKSYFELQNYEAAIANFEKIKEVSSNYKNVSPFNLREIYFYLAKSYIKTGKSDLANKNFDLLIALDKENDIITKNAERKIYKTFDLANLKEELNFLNNKLHNQKKTTYFIYSFVLLLMAAIILFYKRKQKLNKRIFEKLVLEIETLEHLKESENSNKSDTLVTDENVIQILENLKKFENDKVYLNTECTLNSVAKKVNTNTSYLSNVINKHMGKPFKTYLAELRINEALIQLKNEKKLRAYTIKAIASEFGFKRQETFSRAFKLRTGIYPSTYIKNLKDEGVN